MNNFGGGERKIQTLSCVIITDCVRVNKEVKSQIPYLINGAPTYFFSQLHYAFDNECLGEYIT